MEKFQNLFGAVWSQTERVASIKYLSRLITDCLAGSHQPDPGLAQQCLMIVGSEVARHGTVNVMKRGQWIAAKEKLPVNIVSYVTGQME